MGYWLRGWFLKSYYLVSSPLILVFTAYCLYYIGQVWVPINSLSIYWVSSMCQTLFSKQVDTLPCARGASNPVCAICKTGFSRGSNAEGSGEPTLEKCLKLVSLQEVLRIPTIIIVFMDFWSFQLLFQLKKKGSFWKNRFDMVYNWPFLLFIWGQTFIIHLIS